MSLVCLDTTALSDAIHGVPAIQERMVDLKEEGRPLATTAINVYEVEVGIERDGSARRQAEKRRRLDALLAVVPVIPLDRGAAGEAARLAAGLYGKGRPAAIMDALVAATARHAGCEAVLTRNDGEFRRMGLLEVLTY